MEQDANWVKVDSHLVTLLRHTQVTSPLLAHLQQEEVLTAEDLQMINREEAEVEKADRMFELLRTKLNSYPALIQGLQGTGQQDLAQILESGHQPSPKLVATFCKNLAGLYQRIKDGHGSRGDVIQLVIAGWFGIVHHVVREPHGITAVRLIYSMAYLNPHKITLELLLRHPVVKKQAARLDGGLKLLMRFGLLYSQAGEEDDRQAQLLRGPFRLPPLLQKVARSDLIRLGKESWVFGDVFAMLLGKKEGVGAEDVAQLFKEDEKHMYVLIRQLAKTKKAAHFMKNCVYQIQIRHR